MPMNEVEKLKRDIVFTAKLRGFDFTFHSTWGLFSPRRIDDGSYLLIKHMEISKDDVSIDLGCGYGAIGIAIAKLSPAGRVHMIDKDYVALEFARKNAKINALTNCKVYPSNAFSEVPGDVRFDSVAANLPAQTGKELLSIILHDARERLKPGGRIYVVTLSHLRKFIRRNLEEIFGNYQKLKQAKTYTVAMAVK